MKAVVFDMDGVLFDTEVVCMKAWMAIAEKNGLPDMEEIFPQCIGLNSNDSRQIVLKAYGEDFDYPAFRQQSSEWLQEYMAENGLPVKPGAPQILEWLKGAGYAIGLASSTRSSSVYRYLEQSGLKGYFSVVITGDMIEHSKPRPDIYLMACDRLGVQPEEAYAIEDSPNGIRSAHAAGMCPIMVPDMIEPDEEMKRLSFLIRKDLFEVRDYLQQELKSGSSADIGRAEEVE